MERCPARNGRREDGSFLLDQGRQAERYTLLVHTVPIPPAQLLCLCTSIRVGGCVLYLTAWPSFSNHLSSVAAQAGGATNNPNFSREGLASVWGCDAPATARVAVLENAEKSYVYPCFDFTTLADSLNKAGVSWKYYGVSKETPGYVWSPFDAIRHIWFGPPWTANVPDEDQFANDAATDNLAAVSWIATDVEESELLVPIKNHASAVWKAPIAPP